MTDKENNMGRPPLPYRTKTKRIPVACEEAVDRIVDLYKGAVNTDKDGLK